MRSPQLATTVEDLDLIRYVRDHLDRMKDEHTGAHRLLRVATAFVRMAETYLGKYVQGSDGSGELLVGKRKRGGKVEVERNEGEDEGSRASKTMLGRNEPMDLGFLRPLHPPTRPLSSTGDDRSIGDTNINISSNNPGVLESSDGINLIPSDNTSSTMDHHHHHHQDQDIDIQKQQPSFWTSDQGPLAFDWVLWDQSLNQDDLFGLPIFDLPLVD